MLTEITCPPGEQERIVKELCGIPEGRSWIEQFHASRQPVTAVIIGKCCCCGGKATIAVRTILNSRGDTSPKKKVCDNCLPKVLPK